MRIALIDPNDQSVTEHWLKDCNSNDDFLAYCRDYLCCSAVMVSKVAVWQNRLPDRHIYFTAEDAEFVQRGCLRSNYFAVHGYEWNAGRGVVVDEEIDSDGFSDIVSCSLCINDILECLKFMTCDRRRNR